MKVSKLREERSDLFDALMQNGGEVIDEGARGGERWFVQGDEILHESWMACGPVGEPSYMIHYADLENALMSCQP